MSVTVGSGIRGAILLLLALCAAASAASFTRDGNSIVAGKARFQVFSPTIIRAELAPDGTFVDVASAIVPKHGWPLRGFERAELSSVGASADVASAIVPINVWLLQSFDAAEQDGWLSVKTPRVTLRYRLGSDVFDKDTLSVTWPGGSWKPGTQDTKNLGGAWWSLDGLRGEPRTTDGLPGPMSRLGWFILDDSDSPIHDPQTNWIKPRNRPNARDFYVLVYGSDYKQGLRDYAALTGPVPMVPRWSLGTWYSRYWAYSDKELTYIINNFRKRRTPLDILVIDVDWHLHGWEGYDWNPQYFPDPTGFLKWCHDQGLKTTLNNHPGGLPGAESKAPEVRRRMGLAEDADIRFNLADQTHARTYMEVLHNPMLDQGIDFWWIDGCAASMEGLNCMFWTNCVYYTLTQEYLGEKKRAFQFSRWGGHGSHRYPGGFSGDTHAEWGVLWKEVQITSMQGNFLWQWSHDIGGFNGDYVGEELYLRWNQFGVFSPFLRLHSNHGRRLPWEYGERIAALTRDAWQLRYRLIPYIYTLYWQLNQQALSICRPLYLEWPNEEWAYGNPTEYLFGPNLLVAPATEPTDDGVTNVRLYLPPGKWFHLFTGRVFEGGREIADQCPLDRIPVFARAGAVIPMQPDMQYVGEKPVDPLTINVYRGADGAFELYEDDGVSMAYRKGESATTKLSLKDARDRFTIEIGPTRGEYAGAPESRSCIVRVFGASRPEKVTLNGTPVSESLAATPGWRLDTESGALEIRLGRNAVRQPLMVEVANPGGFEAYRWARQAAEIRDRIRVLQPALAEQQKTGYEGWERMRMLSEDLERDTPRVLDGSKRPYDFGRRLMAVAEAILKAGKDSDTARATTARLLGYGANVVALPPTEDGRSLVSASVFWDDAVKAAAPSIKLDFPEGWDAREQPGATAHSATYSVAPPKDLPTGRYRALLTATVGVLGKEITFSRAQDWDNASIATWKVLGVFDNTGNAGMTKDFGPEKKADLSASYTGRDGRVSWQDVKGSAVSGNPLAPRFINLLDQWGEDHVAAYAVTYLYSPKDQEVRFDVGSDDGIVVWLNGAEVLRHNGQRGAAPAQDKVKATLKQGWNEVLLKVGQLAGDWGFFFEVKTPDGTPVPGLKAATGPG